MRTIGIVLLVAGTIIGSLGGAKLPQADWTVAGAGFALLAVALLLLRWPAKGGAGARERGAQDVLSLLRSMPDELDAISARAAGLELPALLEELSALDRKYLQPIADGSPALLGQLGAQRFADVFGQYASGERQLARAWSAAADQHGPEAIASLQRSAERIREAVELLGAQPATDADAPSALETDRS